MQSILAVYYYRLVVHRIVLKYFLTLSPEKERNVRICYNSNEDIVPNIVPKVKKHWGRQHEFRPH